VTVQLQITFRHMTPSPVLEERVRARVAKLETYMPRLVACHVVVDAASAHHASGGHFHVRIDLTVPGHELVVGRDADERISSEDAYAAIEHAFDVAQRLLEDRVRRDRGDVKRHSR
jgi:ribosomal subunit interface protein